MSTGTGPEADQIVGERSRAQRPPARPIVGTGLSQSPLVPYSGQLPDFDQTALGSGGPIGDGVLLEREIRPRRRFRWWQTLPIALLATVGSLMFAFPLAFGSGDGGPMVGMLGLLLTAASGGWGAMAARRVGYDWPGLPRRDSGRRADWRAVAVYTLIALLAVGLAVWRVAHLGG